MVNVEVNLCNLKVFACLYILYHMMRVGSFEWRGCLNFDRNEKPKPFQGVQLKRIKAGIILHLVIVLKSHEKTKPTISESTIPLCTTCFAHLFNYMAFDLLKKPDKSNRMYQTNVWGSTQGGRQSWIAGLFFKWDLFIIRNVFNNTGHSRCTYSITVYIRITQ